MNLKSFVVLGWSPVLAVVPDGARQVFQVTGWSGGSGIVPASNVYIGSAGYVSDIASAVAITNSSGSGGTTLLPDATDAGFTMSVNSAIYLPAATLTTDKAINIVAGANGNTMEFYNNESNFSWLLSGALVYYADGITVLSQLMANTNYLIKKISGKWRILN